MTDKVFCLDCWFEGRVQGVGFRYQTVNVAKGFEVTGSVKNLPDGRVHLCAEGEEGEVLAFQREVESEMEAYIRRTETKASSRPRQFAGFTIAL
ncbi:MAG: acylphosphatase [Verrucomicrobiota bacterium]